MQLNRETAARHHSERGKKGNVDDNRYPQLSPHYIPNRIPVPLVAVGNNWKAHDSERQKQLGHKRMMRTEWLCRSFLHVPTEKKAKIAPVV